MTVIPHTLLSRGLAVALLLLLLASLYVLLLLPLQRHYEASQNELEQLASQLEAYQRVANSRNQIEKLFAAIRPDESALGYYLKGSTQALASAELQAYARAIIEESMGSLVSTQPIVNGERVPERMVKVNVRMRGTIDTLLKVLFRISTGTPVVLTDDVLIRLDNSSLSRIDDVQADDTLDVQFTLTGFVRESVS